MIQSIDVTYRGEQMIGRKLVTRWVWAVAVLAAIFSFPGRSSAQNSCRAADSLSARTVTDFKSLLSSADSFDIRIKASLGIAGTSANKVSYVTTASVCNSAASALNAYSATPGQARSVYVWKLGNFYAVEDPADQNPGSYRALVLYTSQWVFKSAFAPN